ncbi:MAG: LysR family transcriptional regulator [Steroidobacteraceae bacterium]
MTDLLDYEIFARVIKAGSLSAAARELHSSPAMISKRVTRLEDRLGVRLLQRTTRRVTATDVGSRFHERVLAVLAAVDDAESFASVDSERPRGVLRVSLPTAFGRLHVVPRLTGFMSSYPDLRLAVDLNDDYVDLVAGNFDVAVRIGTLPDSSLVARRLAPNRRVLCASPDYIERHGEPRNIADLHHHRLVAGGPQVTWRLEGPEGPITFKPQTLLQTNSSEVVREAVISGMGIGFRSHLGCRRRTASWRAAPGHAQLWRLLRRSHLCRLFGATSGAPESAGSGGLPGQHLRTGNPVLGSRSPGSGRRRRPYRLNARPRRFAVRPWTTQQLVIFPARRLC